MSFQRSEYVMMGIFLKELPFDRWADKYEPYICVYADNPINIVAVSINIVAVSEACNEGFVIGKVLSEGSGYEGVELMSIDDDLVQLKKDIPAIIKEELDMDVSVEDVKLYTFSAWS